MTLQRRLLVLLATIAAASPLSGQIFTNLSPASPHSTEALQLAIGTAAAEYWLPRLDAYHATIDRLLDDAERAELQKLRVRFALTSDRIEQERELGRLKAMMLCRIPTEEDVARMSAPSTELVAEMMEIHDAAQRLAARNLPRLATLRETVLEDAAAFLGTMRQISDRHVAQHRDAIAADSLERMRFASRSHADSSLAMLAGPSGRSLLAAVYGVAIEPIVLLYDGSSLRTLLAQGGVADASMLPALPDRSSLRQNVPNPASTTTTIGFTLAAPTSGTTLELFDASGRVVRRMDLGPLPTGEHSQALDVSDLPSGSYLYRLSVTSAEGRRVQAKTMQIVR